MTGPGERDLLVFALYQALLATSPDDGDRVGMVTLRLSDGSYVGDVWLSEPDLRRITDRVNGSESDLPDVEETDLEELVREAERFLGAPAGEEPAVSQPKKRRWFR